jgi:hypothetical protein
MRDDLSWDLTPLEDGNHPLPLAWSADGNGLAAATETLLGRGQQRLDCEGRQFSTGGAGAEFQ